jgi:hypothetical protein
VFAYVRILLHSSIGDLLLNPYFCPPEATQVKYLRPRCSPTELILWQQGLIPRHLNRFAGVGGGGRGGLSRVECEALSAGTYTRSLPRYPLPCVPLLPLPVSLPCPPLLTLVLTSLLLYTVLSDVLWQAPELLEPAHE